MISRIVVFGAGGRAGRRVVADAASRGARGHRRGTRPAKYPELAGRGVSVVTEEETNADTVGMVAAGHDAAVNAAAPTDGSVVEFYAAATPWGMF